MIVSGCLLSALVAFATDEAPRFETFVGYDLTRFTPNSGVFPSFNANGGAGQFVYNFSSGFGVVFDGGAVTKGTLGGFSVDSTVAHFLVGPRFAFHNHGRFTPFVQVTFGGAYATSSTEISLAAISPGTPTNPIVIPPPFVPVVTPHAVVTPLPISARLVASNTRFAMMAGGGLDIKINKHASFRPIGVDWFMTELPSVLTTETSRQNNVRYTCGFNFTFGAQ